MPYIRLSIAHALPGQEKRFEEVMSKLAAWSKEQPGCLEAYLLKPHDNSGELARISIYTDESVAEKIAMSDHFMALRSELQLAAGSDHVERAFFTV